MRADHPGYMYVDASSTANTLAVSNDIISLGSKVSIAAESLVRPYRNHTITVRADDTMALQAERYHITFERRYEMERIRILVPLRRRSPVERSRHRHHSERRAFQLTFVPAHWTGRCGELKHPSFRPAFRTYPPVAQYPKLSDLHVQQFGRANGGGSAPVITNGFIAYGVDTFTARTFCAGSFAQDSGHRTNDQRPTSWRVYGRTVRPLLPAYGRTRRFQDYIDVYTQTAYDCYRIVVNSISSGEDLVNTGLQMLMLPRTERRRKHSFTGSHLVAYRRPN
jgi:hypothetical protein